MDTVFHDDRPDWDSWFMALCFVVSQRSLDPSTKHGCVVINEDKTILSVGYNSPPRGCDDSKVPSSRPLKYSWYAHSEENAIVNAARHGTHLKGSTFYITGFPCERCLRSMINVGASKIVYGPVGSHCVTKDTQQIVNKMLEGQSLIFSAFDVKKIPDVVNVFKAQIERLSQLEA